MASNINWPASIDYQPERGDYSIDPHEDNARSDFDEGPARVRRRFSKSPSFIQLNWFFTSFEFEIFKAFYKHTLNNGTNWFNVPVYTGDGYATQEVRFKGKYKATIRGSIDWTVSAIIELRELPTLTADVLAIVGTFGSDAFRNEVYPDIDTAVNVTWPHICGFTLDVELPGITIWLDDTDDAILVDEDDAILFDNVL